MIWGLAFISVVAGRSYWRRSLKIISGQRFALTANLTCDRRHGAG
jgi:hypothetical protein